MGKTIDVNSTELIKFTKKLDKMKRSALPFVVSNTLNSLAFEARKGIVNCQWNSLAKAQCVL